LRLYILREPLETLKAALTCEGFIKKGDFLRLYTQDLAVFLHRLEYVSKRGQPVDYACFLREPLQRLERERSFLYIEKAMHDFLMQALRPAKYISFGPEPLVAYYLAKVNEMDLMRMVILAKLNAVSPEVVKERLSLAYV
jgi:V/A-type H+-transporting ATPase subunit C